MAREALSGIVWRKTGGTVCIAGDSEIQVRDAVGTIDYPNAPCASPVIADDLV